MKAQKAISILFIIGLFIVGCSPEVIDRAELVERNGITYKVNSEKGFTGTAVEKYENGQKETEGTWEDGKEDGVFTKWYQNGQKKSEKHYKDGKRNGVWTEWYENGQKKYEVTYKNGVQIE